MTIEIVDFPIKHGDFPWQNVSSPEGIIGRYNQQKYLGDHEGMNISYLVGGWPTPLKEY